MARALAAAGAAAIVTTEKDAVRLLPLRPLGVPVASVALTVDIRPLVIGGPSSDEAEPFDTWIVDKARSAQR